MWFEYSLHFLVSFSPFRGVVPRHFVASSILLVNALRTHLSFAIVLRFWRFVPILPMSRFMLPFHLSFDSSLLLLLFMLFLSVCVRSFFTPPNILPISANFQLLAYAFCNPTNWISRCIANYLYCYFTILKKKCKVKYSNIQYSTGAWIVIYYYYYFLC